MGTYQVVYTATDGSVNPLAVARTVEIIDTTAPTVITQDVTVSLDANGNASITPQVDSFFRCFSAVTLSLDDSNFDCSDIGGAPSFRFDGVANASGDEILVNDNVFSTLNAQTIEAWVRQVLVTMVMKLM